MYGQLQNKKGILFTADAIFAALLIVGALVVFSQNYIQEDNLPDLTYLSYDLVKSFSSIKASELNNSFLKALISNGTINRTNNTLLEVIGELYVLNKSSTANELTKNISSQLIPLRYGFAVAVNDEVVYTNGKAVEKSMLTAKRLISGIEKFKPLKGTASKVFLQGLEEKKDSAYIFFGGFIGQGNISKFTEEIPSDAVITGIFLEAEIGDVIGDEFNIFINGIQCIGDLNRSSSSMEADIYDLSSCNTTIVPGGRNNISITFIPSTNFDIAYISGGFIRFDYTTKEMFRKEPEGNEKYYFPTIDGLINLYSSVYIPGNITDIRIQLKWFVNHTNESNNTFYMRLGNTTVLRDDNSTTIQLRQLDGSVLQGLGLNYSFLSGKNIPIRVGAENVSYYAEYLGVADAILVTDLSESMNWKMDSSGSNGNDRDCDDPNFYNIDTKRISVARCLDIEFGKDIFNITGNRIGLISYKGSTQTGDTVNLTTNQTLVNDTIVSYTASGQTCICCGINSARDLLIDDLSTITLVPNGSTWLFNNFSFKGPPVNDSNNFSWYSPYYNDTSWHSGPAILGSENGYVYSPGINTEIGIDLNGSTYSVDLWENSGDNAGAPNDFSSGTLNYTANTYGLSGADDGWDWDSNDNGSGPFGGDDDIDYNLLQNFGGSHGEVLEFDNRVSGSNSCDDWNCSGAYGIKINITQEMVDTIQSDGIALFSFWYDWDDSGNVFENEDQVWVKARITKPTGQSYYLGTQQDSQHEGGDPDPEIETRDNPDYDFSGTYKEDLAAYIDQQGYYYLEVGGKISASNNNEHGTWSFDDIELLITNATDHYYFRKSFTIADISQVKKGVLNVLSDDRANVYLNGVSIDSDYDIHDGEYWNRNGINIDGDYFKPGNNLIAVELLNSDNAVKFDLNLIGLDNSRTKAMLVMTDGQANQQCAEQNTGDATDDAIKAACDAAELYGIKVYSVGYSDDSDQYTIEEVAKCGNGMSARSSNVSLLREFYEDVALQIMDLARVEQKIVVMGSPTLSKLYGDESWIEINYTPPVTPPQFGEISVNFEETLSQNCSFLVNISPKIRVIESKVSGYSSSKWYDFLYVNNLTVHNLSLFNYEYEFLGDPFIASFDPNLLNPGLIDNITLRTGIQPENSTGCSPNSTFFYTGLLKASVSYSDVLEFAIGCNWDIEFESGGSTTLPVPPAYTGANNCSYTNSSISYNANDTYDDAMYNLMKNLDLDDDGRIEIDLVENNLIIDAISIHKVPYPWGPAIAEVRIWQ